MVKKGVEEEEKDKGVKVEYSEKEKLEMVKMEKIIEEEIKKKKKGIVV